MNNDELLTTLKQRFSESDVELLSTLLFETAHPVGSYLFTNNTTSPNLYLVGGGESSWQRIGDRFLYAVTNDSDVDQLGGERNVTLNINQIPTHTHTRGTMEIRGNIAGNNGNTTQTRWTNWTGAFHAGTLNGTTTGWAGPQDSNTDPSFAIGFTASRNWTGETSSAGSSQSHNNMPPWYGCVVWKRTS